MNTNEIPKEAGFRCNCPGCDGRPHLPCEAIAEFETLRARVKELEEAMPEACLLRFVADTSRIGVALNSVDGRRLLKAASRIEEVMRKGEG